MRPFWFYLKCSACPASKCFADIDVGCPGHSNQLTPRNYWTKWRLDVFVEDQTIESGRNSGTDSLWTRWELKFETRTKTSLSWLGTCHRRDREAAGSSSSCDWLMMWELSELLLQIEFRIRWRPGGCQCGIFHLLILLVLKREDVFINQSFFYSREKEMFLCRDYSILNYCFP